MRTVPEADPEEKKDRRPDRFPLVTRVTLDGRTRQRYSEERTAWPTLRGYDTLLLIRETVRSERTDFLREFLRLAPEKQDRADLDRTIFRAHMSEKGTRLFSVLCGMTERGEISPEEMRWAVRATTHGDMASLKALMLPEKGRETPPPGPEDETTLTVAVDLDEERCEIGWKGRTESSSRCVPASQDQLR